MTPKPLRDVVVLLPGITGSVLERDGKEVWSPTFGAALTALLSLGNSIEALKIVDDPPAADDLDDGVRATRLVDDLHLIPGLWKIDGYTKLSRFLRQRYQLTAGQNYFEFPYDWRRDNRVAGRRLAARAPVWLRTWRERSGAHDARLILIAHSMGGLVARDFLERHGGWRDTKLLITFGTPYRGSLNALNALSNGVRRFGPVDLNDLLRSFTSVYQLLPIYPCYDIGDGNLTRLRDLERVPNLDMVRVRAADAFHREIETGVEEHRQEQEYRERGYATRPVLGINHPTLQSASVTPEGRLAFSRSYEGEDHGGDGTVPRVSATPIEFDDAGSQAELYSADRHGTLQNGDAVHVSVRGVIDRPRAGVRFRYRRATAVAVDLEDWYSAGEPIMIAARPDDPTLGLEATLFDGATGAKVARAVLPPADTAWRRAEFPPQPPGTYRVAVAGQLSADPVTDVFLVG